jgi:hypothetical protein
MIHVSNRDDRSLPTSTRRTDQKIAGPVFGDRQAPLGCPCPDPGLNRPFSSGCGRKIGQVDEPASM